MPVLGLKGTGNFSADQRPTNYREGILYLFPNGSAPLTALMSKLSDKSTDDPTFNVFTKVLPTQVIKQSGGALVGDTTINVVSPGGANFKAGHVVRNARTLEVFWVTADPAANALTVLRGKGTAAAAMNDQDDLMIIGSAYEEGAAVPSAVAYDPSVVTNYCQIFRTVGNLTKTAVQTHMRDAKPMVESKRETLELHSIEMEKAFLFGAGLATTGPTGQPKRTTKGVTNFITTNTHDFAGAVTISDWDDQLSAVFKNGSNEKLVLCGNQFLNVLNQMARSNYTVETVPKTDSYGMSLTKWTTPFGDLMIKTHPLLNQTAALSASAIILDTKYLVYRFLNGRDTQFNADVAAKGDDAEKFEYLTECGLECQFEQVHAFYTGATAFAA